MRPVRWRVVALLLTAAFLSTGCGALSKTMRESTFTRRVVERLQAVAPEGDAKAVKSLQVRLAGRSDDLSLQSLYSAYKAGGDPDVLIEGFVARVTEARPPVPLNWQEAKGRIVPLLRGSQLPPAGPAGLVTVPWEAGLQVVLALEGSNGFVNLIPADLERWQVNRDQLFATALENLRERTFSEPMRRAKVGDGQGLYLFLWQKKDGLDGSRLLLVEEWRKRLLPYIDWDMVVIIPTRDELIAFDGGHRDWVKSLQEYSKKQYQTAEHPVSDQLFAFHDGHLEIYKP